MLKKFALRVAAFAVATALGQAYAADTKPIDVPAGELTFALEALAKQSGVEFVYEAQQLKGLQTNGVHGQLTPEEAVAKLLEGTKLVVTMHQSGALLIAAPQTSSAAPTAEATKLRAADSRPETTITEIVVTATKRGNTRLQDAAFSVRAISDDVFRDKGVRDFTDWAPLVPGLIAEDQGGGERRYIIRGVRSVGPPTVGVYWDDAVITGFNTEDNGGGRNVDFRLYDIERVEVLRGPQGTLYGAGSMSGTIRYISKKPSTAGLDGSVSIEGSMTRHGGDSYAVNGFVNLPVNDSLAIRAVGWTEQDGGFIDDVGLGRIRSSDPGLAQNNVNDATATGGRLALRWEVSDRLKVDVSSMMQDSERGRCDAYQPDLGDLNCFNYVLYGYNDKAALHQATLEFQVAHGSLTASTSYFDRHVNFGADASWVLLGFGIPLAAVNFQDEERKTWSNEIRFASAFSGPFQIVAGAFQSKLDRSFKSDVISADATGHATADEADVFGRVSGFDLEEYALFSEASYNFTDRWTGVVGARWYRFNQDTTSRQTVPFGGLPPGSGAPPPDPDVSASDDKVTAKASLMFRLSDNVNLYGLFSQGFRQGGTNSTGFGNAIVIPRTFKPDALDNYELGAKTAWLANRLVVNASLYSIIWNDIQTREQEPVAGFEYIGNSSAARVDGVELEVFAEPSKSLNFTFSATVLDARLTEDQPSLQVQTPIGKDGNPLPFVPKFTGAVSGQYTFWRPENIEGYVRADWNYVGSSQTQFNSNGLYFYKQKAHEVLDLRTALRREKWEVGLFAENLLDERAQLRLDESRSAPFSSLTNRPRTIGAFFQYFFSK